MEQDQLQLLNAEYRGLTGNDIFAYASAPTPSVTKYVFQDVQLHSRAEAVAHLEAAIARAEGLLAATDLTPGQIHARIIGVDYTPLHDVKGRR